ncbi:hypothetical protein [Grimontia sp. NTOU-MAR1]|uniref:hypothetical protein n=1 Tax=Grimontia sp. NTOU-MAR1 TaxID=3111011 RepID=UPI003FA359E7
MAAPSKECRHHRAVNMLDTKAYEAFVECVLHTDLNIRKLHTSLAMRQVKFETAIGLDSEVR